MNNSNKRATTQGHPCAAKNNSNSPNSITLPAYGARAGGTPRWKLPALDDWPSWAKRIVQKHLHVKDITLVWSDRNFFASCGWCDMTIQNTSGPIIAHDNTLLCDRCAGLTESGRELLSVRDRFDAEVVS